MNRSFKYMYHTSMYVIKYPNGAFTQWRRHSQPLLYPLNQAPSSRAHTCSAMCLICICHCPSKNYCSTANEKCSQKRLMQSHRREQDFHES